MMAKPGKKAALERLTKAREHLETVQGKGKNREPWIAQKDYLDANEAVVEAEKDVRFARHRGWNY